MIFILTAILLFMILVYFVFIRPTDYWIERRVFHVSAFRRFLKQFLSRKSFFEITLEAYQAYPDRRFYGSYEFLRPALFIRDLDLIKQITIKDFDHFTDHFSFFDQKTDPILGQNLFELKGDKWKDMRSTLSPAFTISKIKGMYQFIKETAENFSNHFFDLPEETIEMDFKKAFTRFTNDIIATCAFGIECNSLKYENNEFLAMGHRIANPNLKGMCRLVLGRLFKVIFEIFEIPTLSPSTISFFEKLVKTNIEFRERHNITRPDMIHLLMEARKGSLNHDTETPEQEAGYAVTQESPMGNCSRKMDITDELITAQAVTFFVAGFDTCSTVLCFLSYQLAINKEIQKKLQKEVDEVMKRCSGNLSYEDLLKMKYLDQVISEVLRRYPPGYLLTRKCVKDYKIEAFKRTEKSFILEKGCLVSLPTIGVHMDPILFPDPEKFDPERFSDDNKDNIVPGSFIPFGSGPRSCIGSRFALLECKTVIVHLLAKFHIVSTKKTMIPLKLAKTIILTSKDGFWLGLKKRKTL